MSTATKNGTPRRAQFDWFNSPSADVARELIQRNREDRTEPNIAIQELAAPCLICKKPVQEDEPYLRSGQNTQKLAHYQCIWDALPARESEALKTAFESGKTTAQVKPRKAKSKAEQEVEIDESVGLMTLADYNHKMGKLEGEIAALRSQLEQSQKENARLNADLNKCNEAIRESFLQMVRSKTEK